MKYVKMHTVKIDSVAVGNHLPFVFIGGPDSLESERHAVTLALKIKKICDNLEIPYIFKSCYDKANRTSFKSFRGVGVDAGIEIYDKIKKIVGVPITTDFHNIEEAEKIKDYVDLLQVPALLSRQTDILIAAGRAGKAVNVKKGQFMAPQDIVGVIGKVLSTGNKNLLLTERGYSFGYNNVVADMRSLEIMKATGYPVIFDASHTVQLPSIGNGVSGGTPEFIFPLARAAIAVGIAGVFIEVHDNPSKAPVDGPNALPLRQLHSVLSVLKQIDTIIKSNGVAKVS